MRVAKEWTRERLKECVSIDPENGCWNWQGAKSREGYGRLGSSNDANRHAHRRSHILFIGPIPIGYEIDHLCSNPSCINPSHLEAVTPRENKMRSKSPYALNAAKTHCKRGHELSGDNLRLVKTGRSCRECDRMHGRAFDLTHCNDRNKSRHLRPKDRHINRGSAAQ